jgi:hypothetical protein
LPEFPSLKRGGGYARGRGRIQRQLRTDEKKYAKSS